MAAATLERVCDDCGVALPASSSPKRRYCSNACRQRSARRRALVDRVTDAVVGLSELDDADLLSEPRLVGLIARAGQTEWRAAAWLLERLYPERFGRRTGKAAPAADDGTLDPFAEVDELAAQRRKRVSD